MAGNHFKIRTNVFSQTESIYLMSLKFDYTCNNKFLLAIQDLSYGKISLNKKSRNQEIVKLRGKFSVKKQTKNILLYYFHIISCMSLVEHLKVLKTSPQHQLAKSNYISLAKISKNVSINLGANEIF